MLTSRKNLFSLDKNITYLNCAYMSPMLKSVEMAGIQGLNIKKNPYKLKTDDFFEPANQLRSEFTKLIQAKEANRCVLIPSVSYGMAIVAKNLKISAGENIITAHEQFPSNVYVWKKLAEENKAELHAIQPPDTAHNRGKIWNERILESINAKTKLVALGNIHWADGTKFDLAAIRQRTKEVGALLVIDGTQAIGALPFDVEQIQPDALVCAGYKWLFGAYGLGMAYFGKYFDEGKPMEENWVNRLDSENFNALVDYQDKYQTGALRYEMGERSNFILIPMLMTALQQVNAWEVPQIQAYCRRITQDAITELQNIGYQIEDEAFRASHLFGIRPPKGLSTEDIKAELDRNQIYTSMRGTAIRVSPHLYNDDNDLAKLVDLLRKIIIN